MHANITAGLYKGLEIFITEEAQLTRGCYGYQTRHGVQMFQVPNKADLFESKLVLVGVLQRQNYKAMQYLN